MRATALTAMLLGGALSRITLDAARDCHRRSHRGGADPALPQGAQVPSLASLLCALCLLTPVPISLLAILSADLLPALGRVPNRAGSSA